MPDYAELSTFLGFLNIGSSKKSNPTRKICILNSIMYYRHSTDYAISAILGTMSRHRNDWAERLNKKLSQRRIN